VLADEACVDGFWVALQARDGVFVTEVTSKQTRALRVAGLPSTLPILRAPTAATAPSVAPFLNTFSVYPWRTLAVAPVPSSAPWPIMLAATASGSNLSFGHGNLLKLLAATAAIFGHLIDLARLARLNDALMRQAQAYEAWLVAEDDRIVAGTAGAWYQVESAWRRDGLDLKTDYARLPLDLSSAVGLDLPVQLPGSTSAHIAVTPADFLPPLLTVTFARTGQPGLDLDKLTEAERRITSLILEGLSNREISGHLGRSVATIQNHVHSLLGKLHAGNRRELLIRAGNSAPPRPGQLERVDIGPPPIRHLKKPVS
jgi:DNA-binding CsgD family transcriptional regulator